MFKYTISCIIYKQFSEVQNLECKINENYLIARDYKANT